MPRQSKGARLWYDKSAGLWFIRDGATKRGTGCGLGSREGAEEKLRQYIQSKYQIPTDSRSSKLLVDDVLLFYGREFAEKQRSKATVYAIAALMPWWSGKMLTEVKRSSCQAYVAYRTRQPIGQAKTAEAKKRKVSMETARRELTVLRAAINAYHAETPLDALPVVKLPDASSPRTRWLSRAEMARLLLATRKMEDRDSARALRRFLLIGVHTGTRSGAIRRLGWMPNTRGGWIDVDAGVMHRRGESEADTKKRRPAVRIPERLLGSLRRWRTEDMKRNTPIVSVLHFRGKPLDSQRKAWAEATRIAGLEKGATPHILRHTCTTWMMLAGEDPWDVAHYVGMSVQMIDDVYGHHHPDHQKGLAKRIGQRRKLS